MVNYLEDFIYSLQEFGIIEYLLPFFLVFTIIFAVLQKTKILGEGKKNFNVIVSLIIAILSIVPHMTDPGGPLDLVYIINQSVPAISITAVALIMVFMLVGLFGVSPKWGGGFTGLMALLAFLFVGYLFLTSAGVFEAPTIFQNEELVSFLIIILVFGGIIAFITGDEKKTKGEGMFDWFAKAFEKK